MQPRSVEDYRRAARRRLPPFLFEYVDAGSYSEVSLRRNRDDLEAIALRQRVLCEIQSIDTTTSLFGERWSLPVALSPVGMAGMLARRGEVQAARAARDAGIPFTLSSAACCPLEEVADGTGAPFWFQLYMLKDRGYMRALLARAKARGCTALLLTVDTPLLGTRYRDYRAGISNAPWPVRLARLAPQVMLRPSWLWEVGVRGRPHGLGNIAGAVAEGSTMAQVMGWMQANLELSLCWRDLEWLRAHWSGPVLIKGLLDVEDARMAADSPVDGLIISNHGGRQLDGVPSTAAALPAIVDAIGDRLAVLVDGGVRSGLDVARMLALGARGVMIGRPWAFALAAGGEAAVAHMLGLIASELRVAMALTGASRIADLRRDSLADLHPSQGRTA